VDVNVFQLFFASQQVAKFLMKTVSQVGSGKQKPTGTAAYLGNRLLMNENCKVLKGNKVSMFSLTFSLMTWLKIDAC
jgi:uncharacterized membrane protein